MIHPIDEKRLMRSAVCDELPIVYIQHKGVGLAWVAKNRHSIGPVPKATTSCRSARPPSLAFEGPLAARHLASYGAAGYTAWIVTRRRNMPPDYSLADMAEDHATFIRDHLDGRADLVIGISCGGIILPYLAANHPEVVRRAVFCSALSWTSSEDLTGLRDQQGLSVGYRL